MVSYNYPAGGGGVTKYPTFSDLPTDASQGDVAVVEDNGGIYVYFDGAWVLQQASTSAIDTVSSTDTVTLLVDGYTLTADVNLSGSSLTSDGSGVKINTAGVTNAMVATGIDAVKIGAGAVSNTEFGYLDGVTSAIQTQLDAKAPLASPTFTGNVTINAQGDLRLADSDSSNYVALQAPATVGSNLTLTLPSTVTDGYFLCTNGSGVLSFAPGGSGSGTLAGLSDVCIVSPTDNQVLAYDSGTGKWENTSVSGAGDVVGPASSTANALPRFSGTGGKTLKNSSVVVDDSNNVTGIVALTVTGTTTLATALTGVAHITSGVVSASPIVNADVCATAAIDASKIANGSVSSTEFQYLDGVTSAIQTQIDSKAALAGATFTGNVVLGATCSVRFNDTDNSNYIGLQAPGTVGTNVTFTLPNADGTTGQVLCTNGSAVLGWSSGGGGSGANTCLSNLTSTVAINCSLIFDSASDKALCITSRVSGVGRTLTLQAGAGGGSGNGGGATCIFGGTPGTGNAAGGEVWIVGSNSVGSGSAGTVYLRGGCSVAAGFGGDMNIMAGTSCDCAGGTLSLVSGSSNCNTGGVSIRSPDVSGCGNSGTINIASGAMAENCRGGSINIITNNAVSSGNTGTGDVIIQAGRAFGSGCQGSVCISGSGSGAAPGVQITYTGAFAVPNVGSTARALLGGSFATCVTPVGNVGAGEDDLITYTMPSNALRGFTGRRLDIVAGFTVTATATRIKLYLGSTVIYDSGTVTFASGPVIVRATVINTNGTNNLTAYATQTGSVTAALAYTTTTAAEATNSTIIIKGTGEGVSNDDIIQSFMYVNFQ